MEVIERAAQLKASDIHMNNSIKPLLRVNGVLEAQKDFDEVADHIIYEDIKQMLTNEEMQVLEKSKQLDFATDTPWVRCRINIFKQRGHYDVTIRLIDYSPKSLEELGCVEVLKELASLTSGLVLVTGVTGSGKSTTLAAMIEYINNNFTKNIITLEDPIEYVFTAKKSIIRQREMGKDVLSFSDGIVASLREDPEVILIGEMRDLETVAAALQLAETGHLVLATLHTRSAPETIDRIIDIFPPTQQNQIRVQLSNVLEGVISQMLIPKKSGGRVACFEIMRTSVPIKSMIRSHDNIAKIKDEMFFNKSKMGTQTMTQGLVELYAKGIIDKEVALKYSESEEMFNKLVMRGWAT
jgi:twitching motility protein PilT